MEQAPFSRLGLRLSFASRYLRAGTLRAGLGYHGELDVTGIIAAGLRVYRHRATPASAKAVHMAAEITFGDAIQFECTIIDISQGGAQLAIPC